MEQFYKQLNIPNNCEVNNTIFKKAFLDNADLTSSDKKIINDHIKKVTWKYCLKPETINILPYKDDKRIINISSIIPVLSVFINSTIVLALTSCNKQTLYR